MELVPVPGSPLPPLRAIAFAAGLVPSHFFVIPFPFFVRFLVGQPGLAWVVTALSALATTPPSCNRCPAKRIAQPCPLPTLLLPPLPPAIWSRPSRSSAPSPATCVCLHWLQRYVSLAAHKAQLQAKAQRNATSSGLPSGPASTGMQPVASSSSGSQKLTKPCAYRASPPSSRLCCTSSKSPSPSASFHPHRVSVLHASQRDPLGDPLTSLSLH